MPLSSVSSLPVPSNVSSIFERNRRPDGNYNGVGVLADLTGLSRAEIAWTAERVKHLMSAGGLDAGKAKTQVAIEAKDRPWEKSKPAEWR